MHDPRSAELIMGCHSPSVYPSVCGGAGGGGVSHHLGHWPESFGENSFAKVETFFLGKMMAQSWAYSSFKF